MVWSILVDERPSGVRGFVFEGLRWNQMPEVRVALTRGSHAGRFRARA